MLCLYRILMWALNYRTAVIGNKYTPVAFKCSSPFSGIHHTADKTRNTSLPSHMHASTHPYTHAHANKYSMDKQTTAGQISLIMWGSHAVWGSAVFCLMCGHWAPALPLIRPQFHLEHKATSHLKDWEKMTNYEAELLSWNDLNTFKERRREVEKKKVCCLFYFYSVCVCACVLHLAVSNHRLIHLLHLWLLVAPLSENNGHMLRSMKHTL